MLRLLPLAAALGLLSLPTLAEANTAPGFQDLESAYAQDATLSTARQSVAAAIPPGTPVANARDALSGAGAECKPKRHQANVERCLIHQYSLADGAADDIRWTILLNEDAGRVDAVSLDRYVDRHGGN
jgi:hypothetical protein